MRSCSVSPCTNSMTMHRVSLLMVMHFRRHHDRQILGKKNIRTEEPAERVDTKILETLIEMEEDCKLPPGLRVNTFIIVNG